MLYFKKSQPAPDCLQQEKLKSNGSYKCGDVLPRIKADFKNKCYLCELKEPTSINTEHFIPHRGDVELMFSWDNLFYCCAHCNNIKHHKDRYDNILNCTVQAERIEEKIQYYLNPFPTEVPVLTALENDERVHNTVNLLDNIFNGSTSVKRIESANLRNLVLKEVRHFQNLLFEYYNDGYTEEEREKIRQTILRELRETSNFTSFKRWIIRNNEVLFTDFQQAFSS